MCIMASGIACGRVRTTTATVVESRNMAAMLQLIGWQKHAPSVCFGSMPSFLSGIFKEKKNSSISTNYSGGWFNIFNKGCTEAIREHEFTAKKVVKSEWASAGEEGETVLNNAVSYSESEVNERRWNNSEQRHEAKLTRVIERRRNTRQITQKTTDFPKFKIRASRWVAVQPCKERHMIRGSLGKSIVSLCYKKLQNSKHSGKMWLILWSVETICSV